MADLGGTGRRAGRTLFRSIAEVAFYRTQLSAADVSAQAAARFLSAGTPVKTVVVTDPGNFQLKYQYDVFTGRKIAEIDGLNNKTQYGYDSGGSLRTVTDPNGNVTTTEQDVRGNTISSKTCQNRPSGLCSTIFYTYSPDDITKNLSPNPLNDVLMTVRDGRSASATDNTYLTSYGYDATGNRTSVTDALGRVTSTAYTDGTTVAAVDGGFAPAGLPRTVVTAGGAQQYVAYYHSGDVATITDPAGQVTTMTYDGLGRAATKVEKTSAFPAGLTTTLTYDGLGRVGTADEPAVTNRVTGAIHTQRTHQVFDVDGHITSQIMSDATGGDASRTTSWGYNAHGQQISSTDPASKTTTMEYDRVRAGLQADSTRSRRHHHHLRRERQTRQVDGGDVHRRSESPVGADVVGDHDPGV